jgi:uncharacterized membrane protein YfcA
MLELSLAVIIGLSLGLMGGGGSILTVPVLVYALEMDAKTAIALSLAIVGATSLIGSVSHFRAKNINIKVALVFGPIAMIGTFLGAKISVYMSGTTQLILFAVIMLIASVFMFKGRSNTSESAPKKMNYPLILVEGLFVGVLTGLVGVGGGFMIVPALVLLAGIPMKEAIGTSLLIISLKSFAGFMGYVDTVEIPWIFLGKFTAFTGIGIIIGSYSVKFVSPEKLKKTFAIFLVIMSIFILYKNKEVFFSTAQITYEKTSILS